MIAPVRHDPRLALGVACGLRARIAQIQMLHVLDLHVQPPQRLTHDVGTVTAAVELLTAPRIARLDPALVDSLRNAWGGGDAVWLAVDEAAEFALPAMPGNLWSVWADLQALDVDLVVQPGAGRRKRMLLADMDSTMIRQECIDELAAEAGVGDRVAAITATCPDQTGHTSAPSPHPPR